MNIIKVAKIRFLYDILYIINIIQRLEALSYRFFLRILKQRKYIILRYLLQREEFYPQKFNCRCRVSSPRFLYVFNNTTLRNVEVFLFGIVSRVDANHRLLAVLN